MPEPKKRVKTIKDVEKLMELMQKNRISQMAMDGVEIQITSFQSDIKATGPQISDPGQKGQDFDGYLEEYSEEEMFHSA